MSNFRLGRSQRGLCVVIGMHMLLNISLIVSRGKLAVLDILLELARMYPLKSNTRLRKLNACLANLSLLLGTSLGIF